MNGNSAIAHELRSLTRFNPFCAFFSLYYHILACPNSDDCAEDIRLLQKLDCIFEQAASVKAAFIPISTAVNALNQVSRTIQENQMACGAEAGGPPETASSPQTIPSQGQSLQVPVPQNGPHGSSAATGTQAPQFHFPPSTQEFYSFETQLPQDFSLNRKEGMGYTRAVENEFVERNWHESWWNIN